MSTSSPAVEPSRAEAGFPWLSMALVAVAAFVSAEAMVYAVRAEWIDSAMFQTAWGRWSAAFPGPILFPVTVAVVLLMGIWFGRVADAVKRGWRATLVTHHSKDALNDLLRETLKALSLIGTAMALAGSFFAEPSERGELYAMALMCTAFAYVWLTGDSIFRYLLDPDQRKQRGGDDSGDDTKGAAHG
jgi:hypothetical protein